MGTACDTPTQAYRQFCAPNVLLKKAIQLCRVKAMTCMRGAEPGSIRGDFCIDVGRNVIHGSDAVESAKREIGLWFPEGLATNKPELKWVYES